MALCQLVVHTGDRWHHAPLYQHLPDDTASSDEESVVAVSRVFKVLFIKIKKGPLLVCPRHPSARYRVHTGYTSVCVGAASCLCAAGQLGSCKAWCNDFLSPLVSRRWPSVALCTALR